MRVPEKYYDEVFDFSGQWDVPSTCGLTLIRRPGAAVTVIVPERYQGNPGTSVTAAGYALARQIFERKQLAPAEVRYLECNPDTQSKLSFYDEEYFEVTFPETTGGSGRPTYRQLSREEVTALFDQPKE